MRMIFSFEKTDLGSRFTSVTHFQSVETMRAPGAWISGLENPSWVTPRLDQVARLSSPRIIINGAARLENRRLDTDLSIRSAALSIEADGVIDGRQ